ncbi:uncharacterized protein N7458_002241 [Penicillium daleae]|uniref:Uncharacterized protein n=1 Tax=Penicillium daleae TaxID=63821 RepID=A0AAD6G5P9_9EURO|nr:uncharacterized protein N7458_002241 [Penicillium daleae]KAJ5460689.1 hypothetical protein N7458_002241 [Penicillium daleae]
MICFEKDNCMRMTNLHLGEIDIRCELCETLYCPRWAMLYLNNDDPAERVFIVCANCRTHQNRTKSLYRLCESRRGYERGPKDTTFQEWRASKESWRNSLVIVRYLRRLHSIDYTADGVQENIRKFEDKVSGGVDFINNWDLLEVMDEVAVFENDEVSLTTAADNN